MHTKFTVDHDGIALLSLDHPEHSVNILDETMLDELLSHFDKVINDESISGLVIRSNKNSFITGVDLSLLGSVQSRPKTHFRDFLIKVHNGMTALEKSTKPVVCIINGTALGGGLELALCANRLIGDANNDGLIGFPEIKLGIFPGMGGSVRVPRLIGLQNALEMIFKGKLVGMAEALRLGLLSEIAKDPLSQAKKWILEHPSIGHRCYEEKTLRSLSPYHPKSSMLFAAANQLIRGDSWGCYANVEDALQTIYETLQLPMDQALRVEADYFTSTLYSPNAQAMIKTLFIDKKRLERGDHSPLPLSRHFDKIGIVGAGFMGADIAYASASSGIEVVLIDINKKTLDIAKARISELNDKALKYGKTQTPTEQFIKSIEFTESVDSLMDCELVIEAVFEDRKIKRGILEKINLVVGEDCIIASNTSTLPISSLASYVSNPKRFIGIHFFSPVHKMQLVELIYGDSTDNHTMASAINFTQMLKKTPICVQDGRGFFTTRVVISYLTEGMLLIKDGAPPALIEHAGKAIGMPVGPLALADEIALDLAQRIRRQTIADEGSNWKDDGIGQILEYMVDRQGRLGRKAQKGFYEYPQNGNKYLWDGIKNIRPALDKYDFEAAKDRLFYRQLIEVHNLMQEGIIQDPAQINVGAILGFGFCPWTGGPSAYIKNVGKTKLMIKSDQLSDRYGIRFKAK